VKEGEQILSNYLKLFSGEFFSKIVSYLSLIFIVKYVDVNTFGQYSILLVILAFSSLFIEYGLDAASIYFLAKYKNIRKTVHSNLIIRSTLFILTLIPLYFLFLFFFDSYFNLLYFGLIVLSNLASVFSYDYIFRFYEKMQIIAKINTYSALLFLITILLVLTDIKSLYGVLICYVIAKLARVLLSIFYYYKDFRNTKNILSEIDFTIIEFVKYSTPIFISTVMIWIYYQSDTLILKYFRGEKEVAFYNAAYKFILLFATIQILYNQALFPMLSKLSDRSIHKTKIFFEKYFNLFFYITTPMFFIIMFFSKWAIFTLYGKQYTESIFIFNLLLFSMVFVFNESLSAPLMITSGRSKLHMVIVGVGASLNLILNFFLIPQMGMNGAALSTIIAETIIFSLFAYYTHRIYNIKLFFFLKVFVTQLLLLGFFYSQL